MALAYAQVAVELREVVLRDKPQAMLDASPKGTVPVLVLPGGTVIDESLEIMHWALSRSDPEHWCGHPPRGRRDDWIADNDGDFKAALDRYKYADRYPDEAAEVYRKRGETHLARLDAVLTRYRCLHGERPGITDVALFPFVRQFAMVDEAWFRAGRFRAVCRWLDEWLEHPLFLAVMGKYRAWTPGQAPEILAPSRRA